MSEKLSVTCDECGKELVVDSSYPHNFGLRVEVKDYGINTTGKVFLLHMSPPLRSPKDFCGKKCLMDWFGKNE